MLAASMLLISRRDFAQSAIIHRAKRDSSQRRGLVAEIRNLDQGKAV
jgi:hypothetical protein